MTKRQLHCPSCGHPFPLKALECPYCATQKPSYIHVEAVVDKLSEYRVCIMLHETCAKCGKELRCKINDVHLVHFLGDDPKSGIDAHRYGDLYECPDCLMQVVLGLGKQRIALHPDDSVAKYILENFETAKDIIVVRRK